MSKKPKVKNSVRNDRSVSSRRRRPWRSFGVFAVGVLLLSGLVIYYQNQKQNGFVYTRADGFVHEAKEFKATIKDEDGQLETTFTGNGASVSSTLLDVGVKDVNAPLLGAARQAQVDLDGEIKIKNEIVNDGPKQGVKETIFLPNAERNEFKFRLAMGGIEFTEVLDGNLYFFGVDGRAKLVIPEPVAADANGVKAEEDLGEGKKTNLVRAHVQKISDEESVLWITIIGDWLKKPERKFPVKLDPSFLVEKVVHELTNKRDGNAAHYFMESEKGHKSKNIGIFASGDFYNDGKEWKRTDLTFSKKGDEYVIDEYSPLNFRATSNTIEVRNTEKGGRGIRWISEEPFIIDGGEARFINSDANLWKYVVTRSGLKLESEEIFEHRGVKKYRFEYRLLGKARALKVNKTGDLTNGDFIVPRANMISGLSSPTLCSKWALKGNFVETECDDSKIPNSALPYTIDPTSTFATAADTDDGAAAGAHVTDSTPLCQEVGHSGGLLLGTAESSQTTYDATVPSYDIHNGFHKWDTSSLDDNDTVNSAVYRIHVNRRDDGNNFSFKTEWFNWGASLTCADYTDSQVEGTGLVTDLSNALFAPHANNGSTSDASLPSPPTVSQTGLTYVRTSVVGGGSVPTLLNRLDIQDKTGSDSNNPEAKLVVTYTAVNVAPVQGAFSDSPDPVRSGSAITFNFPFTDADIPADSIKGHACKTTNAVTASTSGGSCNSAEWGAGSTLGTSSPRSYTYTTADADGPTLTYYAFVCDNGASPLCSPATSNTGTVTVNRRPSGSGAGYSPSPAPTGQTVTYSSSFTDSDSNTSKLHVCASIGISESVTAGACSGTTIASSVAGTSPLSATATAPAEGTYTYYAYICDNVAGATMCDNGQTLSVTVRGLYISTAASGAVTNSVTTKVGGSTVSVVNFGEGVVLEFYLHGKSDGTLPVTSNTIQNIKIYNGSGGTAESTYCTSGCTSDGAGKITATAHTITNGTHAASHTTSGSAKQVGVTDSTGLTYRTTTTQFSVSDLFKLDVNGSGTPDHRITTDCIDNSTTATCQNEVAGEETTFNRGERLQFTTYLFGVRDNLRLNETALTLIQESGTCGSATQVTMGSTYDTHSTTGQLLNDGTDSAGAAYYNVGSADSATAKWMRAQDASGNYVRQCDSVSGTVTTEWTISASMSISTGSGSIDNQATYTITSAVNKGENQTFTFYTWGARGTRVGRGTLNAKVVKSADTSTDNTCSDSSDNTGLSTGTCASTSGATGTSIHTTAGEPYKISYQDTLGNSQVNPTNTYGLSDLLKIDTDNSYGGTSSKDLATTDCITNGSKTCEANNSSDGNRLSFDGSDDRVDISNTAMDALTDFTVEGWIKTTQSDTGAVLSAANASCFNEVLFFYASASSIQASTKCGTVIGTSGVTLNDGKWHHVAFTRVSSTGAIKIYVDGTERGSGTSATGAISVSANGLNIGQEQDSLGGGYDATQAWGGNLDEFRVSTNIRYSAGFTPSFYNVNDANTRLLYRFDEGTGTTSTDWTGNGYTATLAASTANPAWETAQERLFNRDERMRAEGYLFGVRDNLKISATGLIFKQQSGSCGTNDATNFTGTTTDTAGKFSVTRDVPTGDSVNAKWFRAEDASTNYIQQCDAVSGSLTREWEISSTMYISTLTTRINDSVTYNQTVYNKGESAQYDFYVYSTRGTRVGKSSIDMDITQGTGADCDASDLETAASDGAVTGTCTIASGVSATHTTGGEAHKFAYTTGGNSQVSPSNTFGISNLAYLSTGSSGATSNSVTPTIACAGGAVSPRVYNLGEDLCIQMYYRGVRAHSSNGTQDHLLDGPTFKFESGQGVSSGVDLRGGNDCVSGNLDRNNVTLTPHASTAGLFEFGTDPVSGTDTVSHTTGGNIKCLVGGSSQTDNFGNYFDNISGASTTWAVSDLIKTDLNGTGAPDNRVTTNNEVYNRGQTLNFDFYLHNVRDGILASKSSVTFKANTVGSCALVDSVTGETSDVNGLVSGSWAIDSADPATADLNGTAYVGQIEWGGNYACQNDSVSGALTREWGVSSQYTFDIWTDNANSRTSPEVTNGPGYDTGNPDVLYVWARVLDVNNAGIIGASVDVDLIDSNTTTRACDVSCGVTWADVSTPSGESGWTSASGTPTWSYTSSSPTGVWRVALTVSHNGNSGSLTTPSSIGSSGDDAISFDLGSGQSGNLESSTFQFGGKATINNIYIKGQIAGDGTLEAQLATCTAVTESDCDWESGTDTADTYVFFGPGGTSATKYQWSAGQVETDGYKAHSNTRLCYNGTTYSQTCLDKLKNVRHARYKIYMSDATTESYTVRVVDVAINYSN